MGSGAFLVEACRAIGERLVQAWARWPETRPKIPADEDEELHARRLVAQRCLYGVDKNPRAVDLARLSLWLATLAKDHEFTFLDHALKSGDSLVGLSRAQMRAANYDESRPGLPLLRRLIDERVEAALQGRIEIREAPDDVTRAIQEVRHRTVEQRLAQARLIGNAVIAVFFAADRPRARERGRHEVESWLSGADAKAWERLAALAATLNQGEAHECIRPFHWEIEFPEVFARDNPGFDAIVGNPPFAGKNTLAASNRKSYPIWLQTLHKGAHGNADLVAHFFRRAYRLLREGGACGLIATNTIAQGDTRATGLATILGTGGAVMRAVRRLKWPGEAAVVVSVVHVAKGIALTPVLDEWPVRRISAYLVEGDLDTSPVPLAANSGKAFQGSIVLGMGFTFDDAAAARGMASSLAEMRRLIENDPGNAERILPYIGGEEVNTDPCHAHHRYVINFEDSPLRRHDLGETWGDAAPRQRQAWLRTGIVPLDYSGPVAADWPDLLAIVQEKVKPERQLLSNNADGRRRKKFWWLWGRYTPSLFRAIRPLDRVLVTLSSAVMDHTIATLPAKKVFSHKLIVFPLDCISLFPLLQSRVHEVWSRMFGTTFGSANALTYNPTQVFRTFPFPEGFEIDPALEAAGEAYHAHRARLMIARNEGLTKTYNRFHNATERAPDIVTLRELHAAMDSAVLHAYGWDDLAARAAPEFIEQEADEGRKAKTRLDWPPTFKDEVLARLLALNTARAAAERDAGLIAVPEEDEAE